MPPDALMLPLWIPRLLASLLCLGGLAVPALAATSVFHSPNDDGLPGSTQIATGGVQPVYLYIERGSVASAAGRACHDGQGDELCGYDLEVTGLGLTLSSFNPDPGANLLVNFTAGSMKLNGLDSQAPTPGPQRIGELLVNAIGAAEVALTSGEVVGADLTSEVLPTATLVTVPEPGSLLLLGSGIGLLAVLARRRASR
jgi:hypothetical protein